MGRAPHYSMHILVSATIVLVVVLLVGVQEATTARNYGSLLDENAYYRPGSAELSVVVLSSNNDIASSLKACTTSQLDISTVSIVDSIESIINKTGKTIIVLDLRNTSIAPSKIAGILRTSIMSYKPVVLIGDYETILTIVAEDEAGLAAFAVPQPLNNSNSFVVEAIVPVTHLPDGRVAAKLVARIGVSMREQVCDTLGKVAVLLQEAET